MDTVTVNRAPVLTLWAAMVTLAKSRDPEQLTDEAFRLYEAFRPSVPAGESGWGAKGTLSLAKIAALAARREK